MAIPLVLHQTWRSLDLPRAVQTIRCQMQAWSPGVRFQLSDDQAMDAWMARHCSGDLLAAYQSLAVGAGRADLWRYAVLYEHGGLYLDIDAAYAGNLATLVEANDRALLSRERNPGLLGQWMLAFEAGHPILELTLRYASQRILERSSNDLIELSGPGVFTQAVIDCLSPHCPDIRDFSAIPDARLNACLNQPQNPARCRLIGTDFDGLGFCKHRAYGELYSSTTPHWRLQPIWRNGQAAPPAR